MTLSVTGTLLAAAALAVLFDQASKVIAERRCELSRGNSACRWVLNSRGSIVAVPLCWAFVVWIGLVAGVALLSVEVSAAGVAGADFIAVGRWPVFNLADGAMVAGMALLAAGLI